MSGSPGAILVVAGPLAAGKSTFIQCLKADALPRELLCLLPESASRWRVFEANDFLKRSIAVDSVLHDVAPEDGLILHFDTTFGRRFGLTDYARDPIFGLMQRAHSLVIVSIHPSPETLQAQFEGRLRDQRQRRGWARELWRRIVHRPLRALVRRARGQRVVDTSRIFRDQAGLEQCYREWTAFARSLVREKPGSILVCVEPRVGRDRRPTFVLNADTVEVSG